VLAKSRWAAQQKAGEPQCKAEVKSRGHPPLKPASVAKDTAVPKHSLAELPQLSMNRAAVHDASPECPSSLQAPVFHRFPEPAAVSVTILVTPSGFSPTNLSNLLPDPHKLPQYLQ